MHIFQMDKVVNMKLNVRKMKMKRVKKYDMKQKMQ